MRKLLDADGAAGSASEEATLSPRACEVITAYVRSRLSGTVRAILRAREKGTMIKIIAKRMRCWEQRITQLSLAAAEQIRLALEAPWMEAFREQVLLGKHPPLPPAIASLHYADIFGMQSLTEDEVEAVLASKETVASQIAQNLALPAHAVCGALKYNGHWPPLTDEALIAAFLRAEKTVHGASRILHVTSYRLRNRLNKLGLKRKKGRPQVVSDQEIRTAMREGDGDTSVAATALGITREALNWRRRKMRAAKRGKGKASK